MTQLHLSEFFPGEQKEGGGRKTTGNVEFWGVSVFLLQFLSSKFNILTAVLLKALNLEENAKLIVFCPLLCLLTAMLETNVSPSDLNINQWTLSNLTFYCPFLSGRL